jgi:hypothetical protein
VRRHTIDRNHENKLQTGTNPVVEEHKDENWEEEHQDWFSMYLEYQAQDNAFFEYLIREDENGRQ